METNGNQLSLLDVVKEGAVCTDCLIEGSIKDKISHFMLRYVLHVFCKFLYHVCVVIFHFINVLWFLKKLSVSIFIV